jgi:hypothetical protein
VFSYANGIVHPYYTVALAPAIGALIGIGAMSSWRHRSDIRVATAMSAVVVVTVVLAAVLLTRHGDWLDWLRLSLAVGGVGAAALLLVVARLPQPVAVTAAGLAIVACLAAPTAYTLATVATPHSGAIPTVGPARGPGGFGGFGGLLDSPDPPAELSALLAADADRYTWSAAAIGSNNAAGYQLASGAPVMAVGGFNGTDPSPTLEQFQADVAAGRIHYFIRGRIMLAAFPGHGSGSREAAAIADWVESHYAPTTVEHTVVYDLTAPQKNS